MKRGLYLVLKSNEQAYVIFEKLINEGYNATIVSGESLRHAVEDYPEEHHFFNLRQLNDVKNFKESVMCMFVADEKEIEFIKQTIRDYTDNFKSIKGFMYSIPLEDYEGSI